MTFFVVICKDRLPRSFRWTIRSGINQPNVCGLSRAEGDLSGARRSAERVFGPLTWIDAADAGADDRNAYLVQVARVETKDQP
jgi:hypothetical protein